jgi:hypothetical protein
VALATCEAGFWMNAGGFSNVVFHNQNTIRFFYFVNL